MNAKYGLGHDSSSTQVEMASDGDDSSHIVRTIIDDILSFDYIMSEENEHQVAAIEVSSKGSATKTKPKIFPCPECGLMFAQRSSALKHHRLKREKIVKCSMCDKTMDKKNLRRHMQIHQVEKRPVEYKCVECDRKYSSRQNLVSHMTMKHSDIERLIGLNKYKCTLCSFAHSKASVVKGHTSKVHGAGTSVNCDECDYRGYSKSGLYKHKARFHREDPIQFNERSVNSDLDMTASSFQQIHSSASVATENVVGFESFNPDSSGQLVVSSVTNPSNSTDGRFDEEPLDLSISFKPHESTSPSLNCKTTQSNMANNELVLVTDSEMEGLCEYEKIRLKNIRERQQLFLDLEVEEAKNLCASAIVRKPMKRKQTASPKEFVARKSRRNK